MLSYNSAFDREQMQDADRLSQAIAKIPEGFRDECAILLELTLVGFQLARAANQ